MSPDDVSSVPVARYVMPKIPFMMRGTLSQIARYCIHLLPLVCDLWWTETSNARLLSIIPTMARSVPNICAKLLAITRTEIEIWGASVVELLNSWLHIATMKSQMRCKIFRIFILTVVKVRKTQPGDYVSLSNLGAKCSLQVIIILVTFSIRFQPIFRLKNGRFTKFFDDASKQPNQSN